MLDLTVVWNSSFEDILTGGSGRALIAPLSGSVSPWLISLRGEQVELDRGLGLRRALLDRALMGTFSEEEEVVLLEKGFMVGRAPIGLDWGLFLRDS